MISNEGHDPKPPFTILLIMVIAIQGCVSVQVSSKNGKPKLIGFGSAKPLKGTDGRIHQIMAPGLSLRLHSYAPGLSLGWYQTRLFYPSATENTNQPARPVAIQNKCIGIDLSPIQIMLGFQRSFAVPMPAAGENVIQLISYAANNPTNTVVERKEIK